MRLLSPHVAGLLADSVNDANSTRKVYMLAGGLALLGVALIVITVWFWRNTRHDPELLAPLEAMGTRKFRNFDERTQQQLLDTSRPPNAQPMRWGVVRGEPEEANVVDLREIKKADPSKYADLREPDPESLAVGEALAEALAALAADGGGPKIEPVADAPAAAEPAVADGDADPVAVAGSAEGVSLPVDAARSVDAAESEREVKTVAESGPDERAALAASAAEAASSAAAIDVTPSGGSASPLVIVPIDHDLPRRGVKPGPTASASTSSSASTSASTQEPVRRSGGRASGEIVRPVVVDDLDDPASHAGPNRDSAEPDDDQPRSIDPLLRIFDRNDT